MKMRIFCFFCLSVMCCHVMFFAAPSQAFPVCEAVEEEMTWEEKLAEWEEKAKQYVVQLLNTDKLWTMIKNEAEALYNAVKEIGDQLVAASCYLPGQEDRTDCPPQDLEAMFDICSASNDSGQIQEIVALIRAQFPAAGIVVDAVQVVITAKRMGVGIVNRAGQAAGEIADAFDADPEELEKEENENGTSDDSTGDTKEEETPLTEEEKKRQKVSYALSNLAGAGISFQTQANQSTVRAISADAEAVMSFTDKTSLTAILNADRQVLADQVMFAFMATLQLQGKLYEGDLDFLDEEGGGGDLAMIREQLEDSNKREEIVDQMIQDEMQKKEMAKKVDEAAEEFNVDKMYDNINMLNVGGMI